MTEDEMVGWHDKLDGCEYEKTLEVVDGQGSLTFCTPCGPKESEMTETLNGIELRDIHSKVRLMDDEDRVLGSLCHSQADG